MRWTTNISAKDKIYAPCILLSRLKFRFDGKENSVIELPKHLRISKAFLYDSFCSLFNA